ncbi:microtubule-associated protein Jupiter-like isoform X3 [Diaphorina citri]|uniref:Microtubule-associated protein Jupiter n=1 Tax=Diaphorina citri TaxID=121845 RepID=A0A1S4EB47_DIACI|nr:microtubule-associated protein Jupiter-like isoform X3 [Diaphorina citri]
MTSVPYNVGVGDLKRPTSKVLKPPGGGSSDIFGGASEPANPQPERRTKNHNQSSLPFGDTDSTDTASVKSGLSDGGPSSGDECAKPAKESPAASIVSNSEPRTSAPARQRVPPGGYSSGLW